MNAKQESLLFSIFSIMLFDNLWNFFGSFVVPEKSEAFLVTDYLLCKGTIFVIFSFFLSTNKNTR